MLHRPDSKCVDSTFSYDVPEEGLAQISGYAHVNKTFKLREASVQNGLLMNESVVK